ncbi:hypothetical protein ACYT6T_10125, partial [Streptococcus pyogenes]
FEDEHLTDEQKARKKRASLISSALLEAIGPNLVGKASGALRKRAPKLEKKIQRGANKIGYGMSNLDSITSDFAYGGDASEGSA